MAEQVRIRSTMLHFLQLSAARLPVLAACIVLLGACQTGERPPATPGAVVRTDGPATGGDFAAGTVGHALDGYYLDMAGARRWYAVLRELGREVARDTSFHFSLQLELTEPLAHYEAAVEREPRVRNAAVAQGLSSRDFVLLTGAMGAVRMTRYFVDSLGPAGRPVNVGESVLTFARTNQRELDSLEASLAH